MRDTLKISIRFTLLTTLLLGVLYPLAITGIAHLTMRRQADGQLLSQNGVVIGSRILGQSFAGDQYFHGRPSSAGNGYDATSSGGSNYAMSNKKFVDRVQDAVATAAKQNGGKPVPIDLVTASGSGLDPDISPAAALYQVARVAQKRNLPADTVRQLVRLHVQPRQFGVLGEQRVNVLELNLALDGISAKQHS